MAAATPLYLDERIHLMRRIRGAEIPTLEQFMKHAEKFGPAFVLETTVECGYGLESCIRIADHCNRVAMAEFRRDHPRSPRTPKFEDSEKLCKRLLGIVDEEEDAEKN